MALKRGRSIAEGDAVLGERVGADVSYYADRSLAIFECGTESPVALVDVA